ncbi:MAG: ribosome maturation factor RimP [Magnetococcales bacterium]|nr:ribosome maturation factor RimP [Magnetococcales bacterium]
MSGPLERILPLAEEAVAAAGCELVDVDYGKEGRDRIVRVFVDRDGGVDLQRCAAISSHLSGLLDVANPIVGEYRLEVSSPGVTRPLKKPEDFLRFAGQRVAVRTFRPLEPETGGKAQKTFQGVLRGMDGNDILVDTVGQGTPVRIPLAMVAKANLDVVF